MATKYTVQTVSAEGVTVDVETRSEKNRAVAIAQSVWADERTAVRVVTQAGNVVFEVEAPKGKRIIRNRTAPYTRVDQREAGVDLPAGYELTYLLPRNKMSVLRDPETLEYLVLDHLTGDALPAGTCREASDVVKEIKAARAALVNA